MLHTGFIVGPYQLHRRLGAGGTAEVWSAQHRILGVQVALKVLFHSSPAIKARLMREGRAQAALEHPNLLPVRDLIEAGGMMALVLPLIEGPSLDVLLTAYTPTEPEAVALFRAIVEGVAHAHARGLVHRDLKPGNVLLDVRVGRLVPRVADFGLVKDVDVDGLTRQGVLMGTLGYAAPEQLLDAASVDARADLFSLGVMLVELLTGRRGLPAANPRLPPPMPDLSTMGADWRRLCAQLLAPHPADRLPDCTVLLEALDTIHPPPADSPLLVGGPLALAAAQIWRAGSQASSIQEKPPRRPLPPALDTADGLVTPSPIHEATLVPESKGGSKGEKEPLGFLPTERDTFVGRKDDLSDLSALLQEGTALVSVVGAGGGGKTRLVQHLARQARHAWPGGVWFCDLSEVHGVDDLCLAMARTLGVPLQQSHPVERLAHAIAGRGRCLLIVDNFEQLVRHAVSTLGVWLDRAHEAQLVVTSREVLGIPGETVFLLPPLQTDDAVELFVRRARDAQRGFAPDTAAMEAIRTLVVLLDHLPLAIELAAARSRLMSPQKLLSRIGDRFQLLSGSGRQDRHATLRATLDWSWELLQPWEKSALAQLSVFEGGFTLESAEAVLALGEDAWPLDAVQSLMDKSLVRRVTEDRLGLLVSVQEYAATKLQGSVDVGRLPVDMAQAVIERHGAHFAAWGTESALASLGRHGGLALWHSLSAEIDNLIVACRRAIADGRGDIAAQTARAAWEVLRLQGPFSVGIALLDAAVPVAGKHTRWLLHASGEAHHMAALRDAALDRFTRALALHRRAGDRRAEGITLGGLAHLAASGEQEQYEQALAIHREVGNRSHEAIVLSGLGSLTWNRSEPTQARQYFEKALAIFRQLGDQRNEGIVLGDLGAVCVPLSEYDLARQYLQQALDIHRRVKNRNHESVVLGDLGNLHRVLGELDAARDCFENALNIHMRIGKRYFEGLSRSRLGNLYRDQQDFPRACAYYTAALEIFRETQGRRMEGVVLFNLGSVRLDEGHFAEAERCLLDAIQILRDVLFRVGEGGAWSAMGALFARQGDFTQARAALDNAETILRGEDRFTLGQMLCVRAEVERLAGDRQAALLAIDEAEQILREIKAGPLSKFAQQIAAERATLDSLLPP